jgi:cyclopropane-fatty-acyl-phospholipid synthase
MIAKRIVSYLFRCAGVTVNGSDPSDPHVVDERFYRRVLLHGSVGLGDSYVEGWWECAQLDVFIEKLLKSGLTDLIPRFDTWALAIKNIFSDRQTRRRSKRVAKRHYDTDPRFFVDYILGPTTSYTCARWKGARDLDEAQYQKMDLLCRKAKLRPNQTVLDIGCGWGGFLAHASTEYGTQGVGLSISGPQLEFARERYRNLPIEFRNQDYRDFRGSADAAVSICMIEHVGHSHLREYFNMVRNALPSRGFFALQCIVSRTASSVRDAWIDKEIFPGGDLLTMESLKKATKGLFHILDTEEFGQDYVRTLREWHANLAKNRDAIVEKFGLSHYRKYEYYFLMCAGAFRSDRITVMQVVMSSEQQLDYVPVRL